MRELAAQAGQGIAGVDPKGRFAVVLKPGPGEITVVPFDGSPSSRHKLTRPEGFNLNIFSSSLDADGRLLAAGAYMPGRGRPDLTGIRILDLVTGEERALDTHPRGKKGCQEAGSECEGRGVPVWLRDGRLVSDGDAGLRVWDLKADTSEELRPCMTRDCGPGALLATPDSRMVLRLDGALGQEEVSSLTVFDVVSRATREITTHGNRIVTMALDPPGRVLVTGDRDGVVRVGTIAGEKPHLLFGHTGRVRSIAVSPDGRWIASGSDDGTIRLWPMPDLTKPPLHTLPLDQLLAKLKSLTNLRAVHDPASDTGWKVEVGPFPGWKTVPTWEP